MNYESCKVVINGEHFTEDPECDYQGLMTLMVPKDTLAVDYAGFKFCTSVTRIGIATENAGTNGDGGKDREDQRLLKINNLIH
jgi:hypothetical protein